jgi:hypothetical protein
LAHGENGTAVTVTWNVAKDKNIRGETASQMRKTLTMAMTIVSLNAQGNLRDMLIVIKAAAIVSERITLLLKL